MPVMPVSAVVLVDLPLLSLSVLVVLVVVGGAMVGVRGRSVWVDVDVDVDDLCDMLAVLESLLFDTSAHLLSSSPSTLPVSVRFRRRSVLLKCR